MASNSEYAYLLTECVACGAPFGCNPHKVPSIRVNGQREPICLNCFNRWNQIHRIAKGLEPQPLLDGAYEPLPETDL